MEKEKIELKDVIDLLPRRVSLTYVDYRDDLDDHTDTLARCIKQNNLDPIVDQIDELVYDQQWEFLQEVLKELKNNMVDTYDIDDDEADAIIEEYDDWLRDEIYNRDDSTPIDDLLRNTSDLVVFYDTGEEFDGYGNSEAQYRLDRIRIKKLLSIPDSAHDRDIDMMLMQASYGGRLVIYFNAGVKELLTDKTINSIRFNNAAIAIIDTGGGSGDHCYLNGHSFTLPFKRDNLFVDETINYNYTYAVCGMSSDWCDGTGFTLLEEAVPSELPDSSLNAFMDREAELDAIFKSGKCTLGDMKYERHRKHTYINDFPCGNKCLDCGTFWID